MQVSAAQRIRNFDGGPDEILDLDPQGPDKFAIILSEEAKQLLAMDRYERFDEGKQKIVDIAEDNQELQYAQNEAKFVNFFNGPEDAFAQAPGRLPCRGLPGGEPKPFPRRPMHRSTERLNAGEPVRIIAIGSSSPPGLWMLTPSATYPEVMRRELARLRPAARIEIINSGASVTL